MRPSQQVLTVFCLSDTLIWKRVIDSQAEKLKELDKEIRPFRQNWEEADSMKSSVESLQNRVTELESVDKSAGQAARNTGEPARPRPVLGPAVRESGHRRAPAGDRLPAPGTERRADANGAGPAGGGAGLRRKARGQKATSRRQGTWPARQRG